MRIITLTSVLMFALVACSEPEPVASTVEEAPPAPEPEAAPPELSELPAPERGRVQVGWPTLESGWAFPVRASGATFGRDDTMAIAQLGDEDEPRLQLNWVGQLSVGSRPASRTPTEGSFSVSFHDTPMRVEEGTVEILEVDDEHLAGTVDLRVRHPLHGDPTQFRARFDARRDTFHDAAIAHQRTIRERLRRR